MDTPSSGISIGGTRLSRRLGRLVWICLVLLATTGAAVSAEKIRVLVLTGETDLPYHDWSVTTPFLRSVLANSGRFDVKVEEEVRGITATTLVGYDVVVLNYNGPRWGETAERAVEDFLRSGKGMIAIHCVSYGPFYGQELRPGKRRMAGEPWSAYADMMGVTWKLENIGHSKRHVFPVKWVDRDHPISRGLDETFVANDELYHKMDYRQNVHVLASAYSDPKFGGTGKEEAMIWTVSFGNGRIVHITLGHDRLAMSQPGFVEAFARGTEWAASGAVTLQPGIASALTKSLQPCSSTNSK